MARLFPYYALMCLAGVLGITKGIVLAKVLGIEGFGVYGLAIVLGAAFQLVIGLGAIEGLTIVLPKQFASGRQEDVSNSVFAAARMIVARATVFMLISMGFFYAIGHPSFALATLLGLSNALITIPMVLARSQGNLKGFGLAMFLKVLATLPFAATGAWIAGAHGAVVGEFLGSITTLLVTWDWGRRTVALTWQLTTSRERALRASGWPLLMQSGNSIAQQNIERWVVVAALGLEGAGRYGFAQIFITATNLVHATFFQQVGANVLPRMAAGVSPRQLNYNLLRFSALVGGCTVVVVVPLAHYANDILMLLLPAFGEFTWGAIWLGAAAFAQMLHYFDWVLIGCTKQNIVERIAWLSTILTLVLFGSGFLLSLSLEFFLFSYFVGRVFVLFSTFYFAWISTAKTTAD